ncbi:MAG: hypothetical protein JWO45_1861, partial [Spartobacteria bacterium]|nr:hypothetical protein [Spartobacteria bacterium]
SSPQRTREQFQGCGDCQSVLENGPCVLPQLLFGWSGKNGPESIKESRDPFAKIRPGRRTNARRCKKRADIATGFRRGGNLVARVTKFGIVFEKKFSQRCVRKKTVRLKSKGLVRRPSISLRTFIAGNFAIHNARRCKTRSTTVIVTTI